MLCQVKSDIVNTKESILSVCEKHYHTNEWTIQTDKDIRSFVELCDEKLYVAKKSI